MVVALSPWPKRLLETARVFEAKSPPVSVGLLILRIYFGCAILFAHALPKVHEMISGHGHFPVLVAEMGLPAPLFFAWFAAFSQFLGALLFVFGVLTRIGAFMVLSTLGVGIISVHWGDPFPVVEAGISYIAVLSACIATGGGRYAVDYRYAPRVATGAAR